MLSSQPKGRAGAAKAEKCVTVTRLKYHIKTVTILNNCVIKKLAVRLEFSDLVALKKKLPNTSFVPLFTSN